MLPSARPVAVRLASKTRKGSLPDFLLPAFATAQSPRSFSGSSRSSSRVGSAPLSIPADVTLQLLDPPMLGKNAGARRIEPCRTVEVQGPRGKMSVEVPHYMTFAQDTEARKAILAIEDKKIRRQREMWGTTRAILNNHILGVSEGHTAILRLNGVGFRATVEPKAVTKEPAYPGQKFVSLKVGYSHPIELGVPEGVTASTPQPTRILLEGADKEVVKQFAAEIREWRKPEPYKGKGIFVNGETIKLKAKKIS